MQVTHSAKTLSKCLRDDVTIVLTPDIALIINIISTMKLLEDAASRSVLGKTHRCDVEEEIRECQRCLPWACDGGSDDPGPVTAALALRGDRDPGPPPACLHQETLQYVWRIQWRAGCMWCGHHSGPRWFQHKRINVLFFSEATALTASERVEGQEASQDQTVLG